VLLARLADRALDLEPFPHQPRGAEWHARLGHAPRSRIHAQEEDFLAVIAAPLQVDFVRLASVIERVVDMRYRRAESQFIHRARQVPVN